MKKKRIIALCLAAAIAAACWMVRSREPEIPLNIGGTGSVTAGKNTNYAVSTSNDLATRTGMKVLESGGNAVDAAVAVAYALAVVEPHASGLGGSGGMVVYDTNTGECWFYDYRACAGAASRSPDKVGVPGFVAGMSKVLADYGSVELSQLLEPAIYYAEKGFKVEHFLSGRLQASAESLAGFSQCHNSSGKLLKEGDTMVQPELAETLKTIAKDGESAFYQGKIADDIAAGTSLTKADLAAYKVNKTKAAAGTYCGQTIYSAGAPLTGITLIQMLKGSEMVKMPDAKEDPNGYLNALTKITVNAFHDRWTYIGDSSKVTVNQQELVSNEHVSKLMGVSLNDVTGWEEESIETTSFSVADGNGLVVTATNTLSYFWGSRICVDGIFMNNTNSNFSGGINSYQPGMRSRSFTCPTILVSKEGKVMALGTPGGNNIPGVMFGVIRNLVKYDMDPQKAVDELRIVYRKGILTVETDANNRTWLDMTASSHTLVSRKTNYWWGCVSLAGVDQDGKAFGAYDSRRGATMVGVYNK